MRPALITAFEPFADVERNPSEDLIRALEVRFSPAELIAETLRVEYESAGARIEDLIATHRPRLVLLVGVARRADLACLERLARNWDDCETADNVGLIRQGAAIDPSGPETAAATAPLDRWSAVAREAGLTVELSDDAGGFLCNHVFYRARQAIERLSLDAPCGFLHLPRRPLDSGWVSVLSAWATLDIAPPDVRTASTRGQSDASTASRD